MRTTLCILFILIHMLASTRASAQQPHAEIALPHLADYDAELRRPDGHVDAEALVRRLKELDVTTYYWLIAHAATDWEDLKDFLPKAAQAHIKVWVYLVPPSESAPREGNLYPEPFRLDYQRWAEEIARLSLQHTNVTGWVIDDFYQNHDLFTPAYVGQMQKRAKALNPRLAFLPLMYFNEIKRSFVDDYHPVIDGVVVAYPQGREEVDHAWAILNDQALANPGELSFPNYTTSKPGDFAAVTQRAKVLPGSQQWLHFRERDDFIGPTAGYHFKQLLVDGAVVWEEDVAGGTNAWKEIALDVSELVRGKTNVTVAFHLLDKQGVGNFGVRWQLAELRAEGLQLGAGLNEPGKWEVAKSGAFEAGFGASINGGGHRFHVPFMVMTAGQDIEFRLRHGDPASPERIASWVRMCLEARQQGKCDGVVTYCLDKTPRSQTFGPVQKLFREFGGH